MGEETQTRLPNAFGGNSFCPGAKTATVRQLSAPRAPARDHGHGVFLHHPIPYWSGPSSHEKRESGTNKRIYQRNMADPGVPVSINLVWPVSKNWTLDAFSILNGI